MSKQLCDKCGNKFSTRAGNFKRHYKVCTGEYKPLKKSKQCKHCGLSFDYMDTSARANHTRWCHENPKRSEYLKNLRENAPWDKINKNTRKRITEKIRQAHKDGRYEGSARKAVATKIKNGTLFHSEETKKIIREKALKSNHRRLRRGIVEYNGVMLDSSWELALAKRLDELNVDWTRPEPIKWVDECNVTHNYFPDFYLPEFDVYLDPKNPFAIGVQKKKIDCLLRQYDNLMIIETLEECENFNPNRAPNSKEEQSDWRLNRT